MCLYLTILAAYGSGFAGGIHNKYATHFCHSRMTEVIYVLFIYSMHTVLADCQKYVLINNSKGSVG